MAEQVQQVATGGIRSEWSDFHQNTIYASDTSEIMQMMDLRTMPDRSYMDCQPGIGWHSRYRLLELLFKMHHTLRLSKETILLAINILDRYCGKRVVLAKHYQLIGCVALIIASKYIECKDAVPRFSAMQPLLNSYTKLDMERMERNILETLDFLIGYPVLAASIELRLLRDSQSKTLQDVVFYICELTLYWSEFMSIPSCVVATSAIALGRCALSLPVDEKPVQPDSIEIIESILGCMLERLQYPPTVLFRKYSSPDLSFAALIMERRIKQHGGPGISILRIGDAA